MNCDVYYDSSWIQKEVKMSEIRAVREIIYKMQGEPKLQVENDSVLLASADMQIRVDVLATAEVKGQ